MPQPLSAFVDTKKRDVSLPNGCKDLADVLEGSQRAARNPIRRFINLILMQAEQDRATEMVIGVTPKESEGTPIRYKVEGCWHEISPFPSYIRTHVISELGRMAGFREGQFPQHGVLFVPLQKKTLAWGILLESPAAECVLTKIGLI